MSNDGQFGVRKVYDFKRKEWVPEDEVTPVSSAEVAGRVLGIITIVGICILVLIVFARIAWYLIGGLF